MLKSITTIAFTAYLSVCGFAQAINVPPTKAFTINGKVKSAKTINDIDLKNYTVHTIGDVPITNFKGEVKGAAKELSGVLLRDILKPVELDNNDVKSFSEYYFVCLSVDGYKVVYSWNELFNTGVGDSVYIVTSKDGKPMMELGESLLMISVKDIHSGRRFLRNLQNIYVGRVE